MEKVRRWLRVGRLSEWLRAEVPEGSLIPWGHGIAYRRYDLAMTVTLPMPAHLVVGLTRRAFLWLRFVLVPWGRLTWEEELRAEAYQLGRQDANRNMEARERLAYGRGQRDGYQEGWDARQTQLEEDIETVFAERRSVH